MLISDKPIIELEQNETVLSGCTNIGQILSSIPQKQANIIIGDANSVLLELGSI